jgi:galactan 5-O-arabinofuranosyltransferase
LFANSGDAGQLAMWAQDVLAGGSTPSTYPPLPVYVMAWWSDLTGTPPAASLRALQVGGAAIFGPAAYVAWRLLVRPTWALVLVLVAALPLMDLYKPYTNVVLVVLLPVLAHLLTTLKRSDRMAWSRLGLAGAAYGVVLGVLFLAYSGWFVWSAPGLLAAAVVVFPWRRAPLRGSVLALTTSVVFVLVAAGHLFGILLGAGAVKDRFFYFDTGVEPAYIAMWRNDTPGVGLGPWPPPGEFAGMGVFSAMLVVGLGLALALGRSRVDVLVLASSMAGAWLIRLYIASRMYADQAVQLYPRTTAQILYSLLALSAIGAMLLVRRGVAALREWTPNQAALPAPAWERRHLPRVVALLSAALLAGLFMGSATADRYMPRNDGSAGYLAFVAHHVRQEDGRCSPYVRPTECMQSALEVEQLPREP